MQIWSQHASQINNIGNLNWNLNIWWNNFNLQVEVEKNQREIFDFLLQIQLELTSKWKYSNEIEDKENSLKNNIKEKSINWVLDSYKEYVGKVKEITQPTIELSETFWTLFKLWSSIWNFITLLF